MPKTFIKIKSWKCEHCNSTRDSDPNDLEVHARLNFGAPLGVCHYCFYKKLEPSCGKQCKWQPITDAQKCHEVTIIGEEEIDDWVLHNGQAKSKEIADQHDKDETEEDIKMGKSPQIKVRRGLSLSEKEAIKAKIRADIIKFKALEHK